MSEYFWMGLNWSVSCSGLLFLFFFLYGLFHDDNNEPRGYLIECERNTPIEEVVAKYLATQSPDKAQAYNEGRAELRIQMAYDGYECFFNEIEKKTKGTTNGTN